MRDCLANVLSPYFLIPFQKSFLRLHRLRSSYPVGCRFFIKFQRYRGSPEKTLDQGRRGNHKIIGQSENRYRNHFSHKVGNLHPAGINGSESHGKQDKPQSHKRQKSEKKRGESLLHPNPEGAKNPEKQERYSPKFTDLFFISRVQGFPSNPYLLSRAVDLLSGVCSSP